MSRDQDWSQALLESRAQLRAYFESGAKADDAVLGVGTEHEKFGYTTTTSSSLAFEGDGGIRRLLEELSDRFGWNRLYDGGHLMALERDGAAITLEPGGQLELSGAIFPTIHGIRDELFRHLREVREIGSDLDQTFTFFGVQPWGRTEDANWMPKPRYEIMREYLPTRGALAHWMMLMTCSIQANYDYRSERDAMDMLRIGAKIGPIVTALFANSPVREGHANGFASNRMQIWQETDPDRCGTPDFYLHPEATFDDYIDYVLDVPMFFIKRDDALVNMAGCSFRNFMAQGYKGHSPTVGDFELHLSTAFPDVRLKKYIEVRAADGNTPAHILAMSALYKGIYYDETARSEAEALIGDLNGNELEALALTCRRRGLKGKWRSESIREIATELVRVAADGLDRQNNGAEPERVYLDAVFPPDAPIVATGEKFLETWNAASSRADLINAWDIRALLASAPESSSIH